MSKRFIRKEILNPSLMAQQPDAPAPVPLTPEEFRAELKFRGLLAAVVLVAGIWAYWPTIVEMVTKWDSEPDYSHGYLVVPMAAFFLWFRRESFPGFGPASWLWGGVLFALSIVIRLCAGAFFLESFDGWSILLWLAGCVALLGGARVLWWSAPSIAFLFFMIPLPFSLENAMSLPLRRVATTLSCWGLQILGQPAISEGHTILLGDTKLEVEQQCSGLRLFMSIMALAFAYLILVKREWWEKGILMASMVPIAVFSNSIRIIATGILTQLTSGKAAAKFSHDFAGWAMIPLAAVMFWLVLWYLGRLVREQESLALSTVVRRSRV